MAASLSRSGRGSGSPGDDHARRTAASLAAPHMAGAASLAHPAPVPRWGTGSGAPASLESAESAVRDPAAAYSARSRAPWLAAAVVIALLLFLAGLFAAFGGGSDRKDPTTSSSAPSPRAAASTARESTDVAAAPSRSTPLPQSDRVEPPPPTQPLPAAAAPAVTASMTSKPPETQSTASAPLPTPAPAAPPARRAHPLPPSMVVTASTPACEIHEVAKGDTLWWIAARRLGSPYKWPKLFGENRDRLADPNVIEIHDRIRVPGGCVSSAAR